MEKLPCPFYSSGIDLEKLGFRVVESGPEYCIIDGPLMEVIVGNLPRQKYEAPPYVALYWATGDVSYYFNKSIWRDIAGTGEHELYYYKAEPKTHTKPKLTLIRGGKA